MTQVTGTQADKELLCKISNWQRGSENYERVMAGTAWTWEVEQCARHRTQSVEQALAPWVDAVEGLLTGMNLWPPSGGNHCETVELKLPSMDQMNAAIRLIATRSDDGS